MVASSLQGCEDPPTFEEQYRSSTYKPNFFDFGFGPQIVAPDTPYVAAAGMRELYFIDTRLDPDTAQHSTSRSRLRRPLF